MGYARVAGGLEPCRVCNSAPVQDDVQMLLHLEEEYVLRVENLDKLDVLDVETVYQAAIGIGSCTLWTPCCGRPTGRRICQTLWFTRHGGSSSTSTITVGPPLSLLGATRSWAIACRISSRTASGCSYRSSKGHTRCRRSCAVPTTSTLPAPTTNCVWPAIRTAPVTPVPQGRPMLMLRESAVRSRTERFCYALGDNPAW